MSIESLTVNRVTSEVIDAATQTREGRPKVVFTDEAVSTDKGVRFVLAVLPIIVTKEGVIHEYTNV